jgi:ankyrin repeat protein
MPDGNVEEVKLRLARGAQPDSSDAIGNTGLHFGCYNNKIEIVRLLVEKRAMPG